MTIAEQMAQFYFLGIDIKKHNFSECIDELIRLQKELLKEKEIRDREAFEQFLYNIKKYPN